jgi:hypothetical protein
MLHAHQPIGQLLPYMANYGILHDNDQYNGAQVMIVREEVNFTRRFPTASVGERSHCMAATCAEALHGCMAAWLHGNTHGSHLHRPIDSKSIRACIELARSPITSAP